MKGCDSSFEISIDEKYIIKMSEYFSEPKFFEERVKVEVDVSNYATKADLKMQKVLIHQSLLKRLI